MPLIVATVHTHTCMVLIFQSRTAAAVLASQAVLSACVQSSVKWLEKHDGKTASSKLAAESALALVGPAHLWEEPVHLSARKLVSCHAAEQPAAVSRWEDASANEGHHGGSSAPMVLGRIGKARAASSPRSKYMYT